MADMKCSYCGSLNGGHTSACSALDGEWDGDTGERRQVKHYLGERRRQVPLSNDEQLALDARRAGKTPPYGAVR